MTPFSVKLLTPINGISKFTKLFSARKAQKTISNLLNHFLENLRNVLHLYIVSMIQDQPAILKSGDAIGAGGNQLLSAEPDSLFYSEVGEALMLFCFRPDPAASHAATEALYV